MSDVWQTFCRLAVAAGTSTGDHADSVRDLARRHADEHRWHLSQYCNRDVGDHAYCDWRSRYWRRFCRWRYVEHLLGVCRYREFERDLFGRLQTCDDDWRCDAVFSFVLTQFLGDDRENVEVLFFAPETLPRNRLLETLELFNMNAARVEPPEWAGRANCWHES